MEELRSGYTPSRLSVPAQPRVVILGDSMASGLGVRERSFGRLVAKELGASAVLFKAKARRMIDESADLLPRIDDFGPDLVIMSTGNAEGAVHPGKFVEEMLTRYGPKSWQGDSGLDARPYFSKELVKRIRERITSFIKIVFKNVSIRLFGGYSRMELEEYSRHLSEFLDALTERGHPVVVVGVSSVDPLLFPKTNENLERFDAAQRQIASTRPGVMLLPANDVVDERTELQADKAHPNLQGHEHIAREILSRLDVREISETKSA